MIRVLMVDDEPLVRRGIVAGVDWVALGCEVVGEAQSGEEGLALARKLKPELIITDIRMPKMDGITMMNLLREEGCAAHCIVLTAHSEFEYARGALLFGADDYLLKPFEPEELLARVENILRRTRKARTHFVFGALVVDLPSRRVTKGEREVALTALEFDLLAMLVRRSNVALSREALLSGVWGYAYQGETRTVDVHIQRLRGKIGAEYIETVYKYGYRFCGEGEGKP